MISSPFAGQYSAFWLGSRSLDSMAGAGILPGFAGIVVCDRYQNCFSSRWERIAGSQACLAHLLRDFRGLRRELPGRGLAGAGAAGDARRDPCLARRLRAGAFRHPR
jgi:hypothetical protein